MTLIRHELKQAWKALLIWTLSIGAFVVICMFMYPEMKSQMNSISSIFASMGAFSSAFGLDTLDFGSLKGFYGIECGNILGIGGALFAALIGIGALANEEKNGTAEFLLTHPLKRTEIITAKLASVLLQVLILNLAVWLMAVGSIAVIGEPVPWKEVTLLHTAYFLLQVELACVCFGISAFLWRGGIGIGLGLAIALYFMNIIGNLTSKADVLKYITPFGYADGSEIFSKGALDACKLLIGLAVSVIGVAAAYWKYNKKDILPGFPLFVRIPEQCGWMIGRHHPHALSFRPLTPFPGNPDFRIQHVLRGGAAQQHNHLRPDQPGLHPQVDPASLRLLRRRHPVVRRAAFHNVADIHPVPRQLNGLQHFRQQLSCRPDKGKAFLVFCLSGSLSDEHQRGLPVSLPGNLIENMLAKGTEPALRHLFVKQFPGDFRHCSAPSVKY